MSFLFNGKEVDPLIEECIDVQFLVEELNGKRYHIVEGVFLQQEIPNKNKRKYSKDIMEPEVFRYVNEMVLKNRGSW